MFKLVVLLSVVALAAAKPSVVVGPLAYSSVVPGVNSYSQYSTSVVHGSPLVGPAVVGPAVVGLAGYAPLAQAPHSPAVVLDAVNGVPLDTPEVVAARAAHYTTKALSGYHHLHKRSVGPVGYSAVVSPVSYTTYSAPLVYPYTSVYPRALSYHPY